jgi:uncharacterized Zn finger protein (UPF0148 family)
MNLANAKKLVGVLLGLSCAVCIGGLLFFERGSQQSLYSAIASVTLLILAIGSGLIWGRCPWCGKILIRGLFSKTMCPSCRRDLTTGKKKKGKGGKK